MRLLIIYVFLISSFSASAQSERIQKEEAWLAAAKVITQVHNELSQRATKESYGNFWDDFESNLSKEDKKLFTRSSIRDFELRTVFLKSLQQILSEKNVNGAILFDESFWKSKASFPLKVICTIFSLNDSNVTPDI